MLTLSFKKIGDFTELLRHIANIKSYTSIVENNGYNRWLL